MRERRAMKTVWGIVQRVLFALLVLALLSAARFRYDHIVMDNETYLVRVNRLSGHADILIPGEGWVPSEEAWSDAPEEPPLTAS